LMLGWDNVPMHRWAQSQMFRSLAYYHHESRVRDRRLRMDREQRQMPIKRDRKCVE
jgi:hypothetical protein